MIKTIDEQLSGMIERIEMGNLKLIPVTVPTEIRDPIAFQKIVDDIKRMNGVPVAGRSTGTRKISAPARRGKAVRKSKHRAETLIERKHG